MGIAAIIGAAVQILDIVLGYTSKHPETAPHFAPLAGQLISIASRAAEETPEETAKRLEDHDELVAQYGAAPPPGVTP